MIYYHAPRDAAGATQWANNKMPDPTNGYDTPSTVAQILANNAAIEAVCGKQN